MENLTFIIPVQIDSRERLLNLRNNVGYLISFNCPILIIDSSIGEFKNTEALKIENGKCVHIPNPDGIFRKSKLINKGVLEIETEYFAMIDADAIFTRDQLLGSYRYLLQCGGVVYPYSGVFVDVNFGIIPGGQFVFEEIKKLHENSVGGGFLCQRDHFFEIGGMNENFVSWGYEDDEFHYRARVLSNVKRWSGICCHQTHPRGDNSSSNNPYYESNRNEYARIMKMSRPQLINEIKTWVWCQKKY